MKTSEVKGIPSYHDEKPLYLVTSMTGFIEEIKQYDLCIAFSSQNNSQLAADLEHERTRLWNESLSALTRVIGPFEETEEIFEIVDPETKKEATSIFREFVGKHLQFRLDLVQHFVTAMLDPYNIDPETSSCLQELLESINKLGTLFGDSADILCSLRADFEEKNQNKVAQLLPA